MSLKRSSDEAEAPRTAVVPQPAKVTKKGTDIMRRTAFVSDERFFWHTCGVPVMGCDVADLDVASGIFVQASRHFENSETKRRALNLLDACGLLAKLDTSVVKHRVATDEELLLVHKKKYIDLLRSMEDGGDAGDFAQFGRGSFYIATLAAGTVIEAVRAVMSRVVHNAYVLCRPPGHHAERDRGMGFCLLNNVAIAASFARQTLGVERVAIVDYDVHHGNGTQQAFLEDDSVLFISIHQDGLYPLNSGSSDEQGTGRGKHYTINVPLPPGSGVGAYEYAFSKLVIPTLTAFRPDLLLVSSGFDASYLDPLGTMMVTAECFGRLAKSLVDLEVPAVFVHEGGYSENHAPFCGFRVVEAMCGLSESPVKTTDDGEAALYAYQALQPWQKAIVDESYSSNAAPCIARCESK